LPQNEYPPTEPDVDVVVVGAGMAGIYAIHRLVELGFTVQGLEAGGDVGGVWYHNRYPGAHVDVESLSYSYMFSSELYNEWTWSKRLAGQPEILAYLNHVADKYGVRERIRFNARVTRAQWDESERMYTIAYAEGPAVTCRFLVMATGHLSAPRDPEFEGLADFEGEWVQTAEWPEHDVEFAGRRVGVIGTGSSGTQVIPVVARQAGHLTVFQRTANYGIPAQNGPNDEDLYASIRGDVDGAYRRLLGSPAGILRESAVGPAGQYSRSEQLELLEERWRRGANDMNLVFTDQGINQKTNDIVAEFVRDKIRRIVNDPDTISKLLPREYPIGTRRLAVNTGYYEAFNRENVDLVDIRADPIVRFTPAGIQTLKRHFDLDLVIFAIGFEAFTGSIRGADIRNQSGEEPTARWGRGPLTYLGLMTAHFPNVFFISGPGSPSVLANLFTQSVYHVDVIGGLLVHMREIGSTRVEPDEDAEREWSTHVDDVAKPLLRRMSPNYMMHINSDDGSRVFIPYAGGLGRYVEEVDDAIARNYAGFVFS
jgi:cation diffusion facilitator CzcD-associated flavoprotein CzcO